MKDLIFEVGFDEDLSLKGGPPKDKMTISVPNADTNLGNYTVCPKEVIQKAYKDKIGGTIEFCGVPMKVVDVRITDEYIFMDLEKV